MPIEGNSECLQVALNAVEEIKKGRICGLGITMNDGTSLNKGWVAMTGVPEYMAFFGAFSVAMDIYERIWARQAPSGIQTANEKTAYNKVIFNAANLTLGYDFLVWLLAQEMQRIKHKAEGPLMVAISVGKDWGTRPTKPDQQQMLEHVCVPLVQMIGGVMRPPEVKMDDTWLACGKACFNTIVDLSKEGVPYPRFQTEEWAEASMRRHKGKVTITLREALHWPDRNSRFGEWAKVADWLEERGEKVLFVRDTERGDEPLQGYETEPLASKDIKCRAALYANAKCNLFVSNGPIALDWFCGATPSLSFIPINDDTYKCSSSDWWYVNQGIRPPEQFPFFKGTKKSIVWEYPTFEVVTKAYEKLFKLKKTAKLKRAA